MVFKLCLSVEKRWRRLNGAEQLTALMTGQSSKTEFVLKRTPP